MSVRSVKSLIRLPFALTFLLLLSGLPFAAQGTAAQEFPTQLQILHAGPDVGKVEVHINGEGVADEFEYGDMTDWIDLDPGTARLTITVDRAGFNYVIFDSVYPVPVGNQYYAVITDALIMGGAFDVSPIVADGSRVQFNHASVDTPAVNVVAVGEDAALASQLQFARTSEAAPLPAGTYDFEVTAADSGESLLTATGIVIEPGKSYQFVLSGTPGDSDHPLELVTLETSLSDEADATPAS
jgi:hypothetical protein